MTEINRPTVVFDVEELMDRCLNDPDFATEMLRMFHQQADQLVQKVVRLVEAGTMEDAAKAAHSLKGTAGNLAAKRVHPIAAEMERLLRREQLSAAQDLLPVLQTACNEALQAVDRTILSISQPVQRAA